MLQIALVFLLILNFDPQIPKRKKAGKTKKAVVAEKKAEMPDPAREAIKTLRTMGTVAEIGTTYSDYTTRLADVKIKVDELLLKVPPDDSESAYQPKHDIERALDSYVSAARYWQMLIKNPHSDLDSSYKKLIDNSWQQAKMYLDMATKALDKKKL